MKKVTNLSKLLICLTTVIFYFYSCHKNESRDGSMPCISSTLTNNVIAFYPFSNSSINDFSGNSYNLINSGGASGTSDRNGNSNCAIKFTHDSLTEQFLFYSNPTFLNNLSQYSISLWYQITDSLQTIGNPSLLILRDSNSLPCKYEFGQWSIAIFDCNRALFSRTTSVWDETSPTVCPLPTNVWHHAVATYNSNGNAIAFYIDGILQGNGNGNDSCGSSITTSQDIGDLFLGRNFTGKLDDVIIFNKELNQQEVTSLFTAGGCCQ